MAKVERLLLVYNMDWTLGGALRYAAARITTGDNPCALCALTYDGLRPSRAWETCSAGLGVPVDEAYRDQLDDAMTQACGDRVPCVLAQSGERYYSVADVAQLTACHAESGDARIGCLETALREGVERAGLTLV